MDKNKFSAMQSWRLRKQASKEAHGTWQPHVAVQALTPKPPAGPWTDAEWLAARATVKQRAAQKGADCVFRRNSATRSD